MKNESSTIYRLKYNKISLNRQKKQEKVTDVDIFPFQKTFKQKFNETYQNHEEKDQFILMF